MPVPADAPAPSSPAVIATVVPDANTTTAPVVTEEPTSNTLPQISPTSAKGDSAVKTGTTSGTRLPVGSPGI